MPEEIKIMDTGDGSHTLLHIRLDETYHSRHGALQESRYVFLQEGLEYWINTHPEAQNLSIFEMGMGTALNLILTVQSAISHAHINFTYITLEAFPLPEATLKQLNYVDLLQDQKLTKLFEKTHQLEWDEWHRILPNFRLKKIQQKLEDYTVDKESTNLIYYDAFAPNKQAELWTLNTLSKVCSMMKADGVFVTYSAKGQLKRDLKSLNLSVETLPGPPGKAEMVRAIK